MDKHRPGCGACRSRGKPRHLPTPGLAGDVIGFDLKTVKPHNGDKWLMLLAVDFLAKSTLRGIWTMATCPGLDPHPPRAAASQRPRGSAQLHHGLCACWGQEAAGQVWRVTGDTLAYLAPSGVGMAEPPACKLDPWTWANA